MRLLRLRDCRTVRGETRSLGCKPPPGAALGVSDRFPIRLAYPSGGLFPTAFALSGQFLPHWLVALGSCRNGAPGFLGMLLRFTFDFVFGELKLCGLHNDRCRLQALDRPKDHLFQVPECADLTTQELTTLNAQLSTLKLSTRFAAIEATPGGVRI